MDLWDVLEGLGYALDTPGALTRGALSGRLGERASGRDMLESWGVLGANQDGFDAGDVAGFGADMLFDPLNFVGGGAVAKAMGLSKAAKASNASSKAMRAAGAMPEEIAKLTKVVDESGKPLRTYHGTTAVFDKFDPERLDPSAIYGKGIYTTADPEVASTYTRKGANKPEWSVQPVDQRGIIDEYRKIHAERFGDDTKYKGLSSSSVQVDDEMALSNAMYQIRKAFMDGAPRPGWADEYLKRFEPHIKQVPDTGTARNVRMQYIDSRKPFDVSAPAEQSLWDDLSGSLMKQEDEMYGESSLTTDYLKSSFGDTGQGLLDASDDYYHIGSGADRIKRHGYDSILHQGGARTNNKLHDVVIAFDPSQIYAPYIAPAMRDVPRVSPYAAAVLGYNAGVMPARFE